MVDGRTFFEGTSRCIKGGKNRCSSPERSNHQVSDQSVSQNTESACFETAEASGSLTNATSSSHPRDPTKTIMSAHTQPIQYDLMVDPLSIDDVLAFLDECDMGQNDHEAMYRPVSAHSPVSAAGLCAYSPMGHETAATNAAQPTTKRVRRQRLELLALRDSVKQLEQQLKALEQNGNVSTQPQGSLVKSMSVWGRAAQQESRHHAEAVHQNAQLKAMIQSQAKLLKSLSNAMNSSRQYAMDYNNDWSLDQRAYDDQLCARHLTAI